MRNAAAHADDAFGSALDTTLEALGAVRGADTPAVAGALLVEQYALRLAAPVAAAFTRAGAVLDARPPRVRVQVVDGAVRRLAFDRPPRPGPAGPGDVARSLREGIDPVVDAVHRRTRAGRRTLRGAMANAVANAYLHLSWHDADRARHVPDAQAVLAAAGWADLVRVFDVDGWMYSDRNTCCLAFRTSVNAGRDQHYCLTCPITPRETTLSLFREATASFSERHPR